MKKNNRAARAARTLVQFFDVSATWQREISRFKVFNDNVNTQEWIILYIYFNGASPVHLQRALSRTKDARKKQ